MISWFDAHNHLQDPRFGSRENLEEIIATSKRAGVIGCVVNATSEADWSDVEILAARHPGWIIPSFGVHPWYAQSVSVGWQDRLRAVLVAHPDAGIGECGIDRHRANPSLDVQMSVFLAQLRLAHELDRAASIHCIKAWGLLIDALETIRPPRFMVHGFSGSAEIARRLAVMGAFFSFSSQVLYPRSLRLREVLQSLPMDRLVVETDAPNQPLPEEIVQFSLPGNMMHHPANLPFMGAALASMLGMPPDELASITQRNLQKIFAPMGTQCDSHRSPT